MNNELLIAIIQNQTEQLDGLNKCVESLTRMIETLHNRVKQLEDLEPQDNRRLK